MMECLVRVSLQNNRPNAAVNKKMAFRNGNGVASGVVGVPGRPGRGSPVCGGGSNRPLNIVRPITTGTRWHSASSPPHENVKLKNGAVITSLFIRMSRRKERCCARRIHRPTTDRRTSSRTT